MSAGRTGGNGGKEGVKSTLSPDEKAWIDRACKPEVGDVILRDQRLLTVVSVDANEVSIRFENFLTNYSFTEQIARSDWPRRTASTFKIGCTFYPFGNGFDRESFIKECTKPGEARA